MNQGASQPAPSPSALERLSPRKSASAARAEQSCKPSRYAALAVRTQTAGLPDPGHAGSRPERWPRTACLLLRKRDGVQLALRLSHGSLGRSSSFRNQLLQTQDFSLGTLQAGCLGDRGQAGTFGIDFPQRLAAMDTVAFLDRTGGRPRPGERLAAAIISEAIRASVTSRCVIR